MAGPWICAHCGKGWAVRQTVCECGRGAPPDYQPPELQALAGQNGSWPPAAAPPVTALEAPYLAREAPIPPEMAQLFYTQQQQLAAATHEKQQLLQAFATMVQPLLDWWQAQGRRDVTVQTVIPLTVQALQARAAAVPVPAGTSLSEGTLQRLTAVLERLAQQMALPPVPSAPLPGYVHTDASLARLEREMAQGQMSRAPELPDERFAR